MKNRTKAVTAIAVTAAIILLGTALWGQKEKNNEKQEQDYVQEHTAESAEGEVSDEPITISEESNDSIEKNEDDGGEYLDTEQESIPVEEPEQEELSEEEQIMAWYDEWFNMDNPLWDSYEREFWQKRLTYLLSEPYHFIMFVNLYDALDTYKYRNIDDEMLYDEDGNRTYMQGAYIADIVLDKYIREYGGKGGQYHIKDTSADLGNSWETGLWEVSAFEISNNKTKLRVTWDGHNSFVGVYIEGDGWEKVTELEKKRYLYYQNIYDYYCYSAEDDEYWLLLEPAFQQKEYSYRNVKPNLEEPDGNGLECDERAYYIADQAIDKYIRVYGGNDSLYSVELMEKEADAENGGYAYVLSVENLEDSEQIMQIEYSDTDWLVSVKVPDGQERRREYVLFGDGAYHYRQ